MSRHKSSVLCSLESLCAIEQLDISNMSKKAKLLLGLYRQTRWTTGDDSTITAEVYYKCSAADIRNTITYLETFSPELSKSEFKSNIQKFANYKCVLEFIEQAMVRVKEYPIYGDLYFDLLSTVYLNRFKYSEQELLDILRIERSCYFDRKKEAVIVFGCAFWGQILPLTYARLQCGNIIAPFPSPDPNSDTITA